MPRPNRRKSQSAPHPLAEAIRAEASKEPPADPRPQSIPAAVWSVLRGLRNRGYSVQQISTFLGRHGYHVDPETLAARLRPRTPRPAQSPATAASTAAPAPSSHADPTSDPAAPSKPDATQPTAGTAVGLTPEQRAEFRIPEWADGSDLRPGESLEKYAVRKRVSGPPKSADELRKFIGEGRRDR